MKSKLYRALVLVGISWGAAGAGCSGQSKKEAEGEGDPGGSSGNGGRNVGGRAGGDSATAGTGDTGGTAGRSPGTGGTSGEATGGAAPEPATGGTGTGGDGEAGEGGSEPGAGGSAGNAVGGSAGTAGNETDGGIQDAGMDATDAFCDMSWPTTKGNPAPPPTCEDQAECGGPPFDASFNPWLRCRTRLGDHQCDHPHVTSVCENGEWQCPEDGMEAGECWCTGPRDESWTCTNQGWVPVDAGSGGAAGAGGE